MDCNHALLIGQAHYDLPDEPYHRSAYAAGFEAGRVRTHLEQAHIDNTAAVTVRQPRSGLPQMWHLTCGHYPALLVRDTNDGSGDVHVTFTPRRTEPLPDGAAVRYWTYTDDGIAAQLGDGTARLPDGLTVVRIVTAPCPDLHLVEFADTNAPWWVHGLRVDLSLQRDIDGTVRIAGYREMRPLLVDGGTS